ncbi:MAG: TonB-dependent receptor domain-containing protein [Bacteroidota bacterium]
MGRKLYLSLVVLILLGFTASAQTGEIRGKVTESGSSEGVPFASVTAKMNNSIIQGAITDIDGNYVIKPLNPGKYDIEVTSIGYQPARQTGITVSIDKISFVNMTIGKGIDLKDFVITEYKVPLIDKGNPATSITIDIEQIQQAPTRDVNSLASAGTGVFQKDEGGALNIRGSRSDGTAYYVDGIKVRGGVGLPQKGTEQITVITGGVPAQYGDATGGIISVTTRGPSKEWSGGIELATSEFLDDFGYNLASFDISGPLYSSKDSTKKTDQAIAGFFIAGEYQYDKDPAPPGISVYKVNDDLLNDVRLHPLVRAPQGDNYIHRSHYFTISDLTKQAYRENVSASAMRLNAKLDFRPAKNSTLTFGGSVEHTDQNIWIDNYALMNYDQNPQTLETNWRVFGKFTQRFNSDSKEGSSSVLKNAFYSVQVDYSNNYSVTQNRQHKDKVFDYGYVGKFVTSSAPAPNVFGGYGLIRTETAVSGEDSLILGQAINRDTLVEFTPGTQNPYTSNYTAQYFEMTDPFGTAGYQENLVQVESGGGLLNGDNRTGLNVYGIWSTPGRVRTGYSIDNNSQFRVSTNGSVDIKNHNIVLGLEYEQRTDRGYTITPNALWGLMRQLSNQNLRGPDLNSGYVSQTLYTGTQYLTLINYTQGAYFPNLVDSSDSNSPVIKGFYENVRDVLGVGYGDTIQIDAYDPSSFSLDMFTPDELLNNGGSFVDYYGYNYIGELDESNSWNLANFYTDEDDTHNKIRRIDAFRPTYIAGYISDRFTFDDVIFNVGVRVDRFDANQYVLKDANSLYEIRTASDGEVNSLLGSYGGTRPGNIGDDFAVYVDNSENPTAVVGYRDGNQWYNSEGVGITDLKPLLETSGGIQPYLSNYSDYVNNNINTNAFKDYEPQVNVMPRVAFSFPISDEAYFSAHYDILTQRPQNLNLIRFNPITYLGWAQGIGGNFSNPDLKPETTTDYEISFQQKISKSSAFTIAAFYKELRDMVQIISLDYAFPRAYTTYGNIDFGTVKGLSFSYDLRRTSNVRMNVSYTLQFADGTGSDATSSSGILSQAGQTNLREIKPLSFDQRHTFVTSFDFRYGSGKSYTGPVWFNKQVLSDAGLNLVFRAGSGTPYTRKSNITPTADFTTTANSRSVIAGQINGSRYPWQFKIDAKLDKNFSIKTGKKKNGDARKEVYANVYLQVLNVLNTQNVSSVYAATGSPSDDGYVTSPAAQSSIASKVSPQAYIDLYRLAVNDPNNYSQPRRIHLGVQFNF